MHERKSRRKEKEKVFRQESDILSGSAGNSDPSARHRTFVLFPHMHMFLGTHVLYSYILYYATVWIYLLGDLTNNDEGNCCYKLHRVSWRHGI